MSYSQVHVGVTGSICTGKTTVCRMLRMLKIPVFSADDAVHEVLESDKDCIQAIKAQYPDAVQNQQVNRNRLGEIVFMNPEALQWLESLVHPRVEKLRQEFVSTYEEAPLLVSEIPLLYEVQDQKKYTKTVVISCSAQEQQARLAKRSGMTKEKMAGIMNRQLSLFRKESKSDYVIYSDSTKVETFRQVRKILETCQRDVDQS